MTEQQWLNVDEHEAKPWPCEDISGVTSVDYANEGFPARKLYTRKIVVRSERLSARDDEPIGIESREEGTSFWITMAEAEQLRDMIGLLINFSHEHQLKGTRVVGKGETE